MIHVSYCSGLAGIEAAQASSAQNLLSSTSASTSTSEKPPPSISDRREDPRREEESSGEKIEQNFSKKRVGEGDVKLDKDRLAHALREEKKRKMRGEDEDERLGKKKKTTGPDGGSHDVTEEELGMFFDFSFALVLITFSL